MIKYSLLVIIIFFIFTRLLFITEIPKSLYWDEVSIGYNAYSILKTGADEWGKFMPLHFRAFGEFKLPVYIYTVSIFQIFLGLSELSVRLPAVIFSLVSVVLIYFITVYLFKNKTIGLLSAFLMTVSPWLFIFSRTGYEATAGLMFFLIAILSFLLSERKPVFLIVSAFSFIACLYSYNAYRVIIPLAIPILLILLKGHYSKAVFKYLFVFMAVLTIAFIPILRLNLSSDGAMRYQAIGIDLHKPLISLITEAGSNYFKNLSPQFLFITGDSNLRSQQMGFGQFYYVDLIFICFGLYILIKKFSKQGLLIISLFLISIVPAAITKESPHALRSLSVVPFYSIIAALGIYEFSKVLRGKLSILLIILIYLGFFGNYFYNFLYTYPDLSETAWQYPYKVVNQNYSAEISKADKVWITDKYAQPYIYTFFYQAIDPQSIQSNIELNSPDKWGVSKILSFDKFNFGLPPNQDFVDSKNILIFTSPEEKLNIESMAKIGEAINVYKKE